MAFKAAPQVLARRMPEGTVLVHLVSNRIFELNESGARIWEMLHGGLDRARVVETLIEEFDVDAERASRELDELVEQLLRERLLQATDGVS